jgi:hypothetical protein
VKATGWQHVTEPTGILRPDGQHAQLKAGLRLQHTQPWGGTVNKESTPRKGQDHELKAADERRGATAAFRRAPRPWRARLWGTSAFQRWARHSPSPLARPPCRAGSPPPLRLVLRAPLRRRGTRLRLRRLVTRIRLARPGIRLRVRRLVIWHRVPPRFRCLEIPLRKSRSPSSKAAGGLRRPDTAPLPYGTAFLAHRRVPRGPARQCRSASSGAACSWASSLWLPP